MTAQQERSPALRISDNTGRLFDEVRGERTDGEQRRKKCPISACENSAIGMVRGRFLPKANVELVERVGPSQRNKR